MLWKTIDSSLAPPTIDLTPPPSIASGREVISDDANENSIFIRHRPVLGNLRIDIYILPVVFQSGIRQISRIDSQ